MTIAEITRRDRKLEEKAASLAVEPSGSDDYLVASASRPGWRHLVATARWPWFCDCGNRAGVWCAHKRAVRRVRGAAQLMPRGGAS